MFVKLKNFANVWADKKQKKNIGLVTYTWERSGYRGPFDIIYYVWFLSLAYNNIILYFKKRQLHNFFVKQLSGFIRLYLYVFKIIQFLLIFVVFWPDKV